MKTLAFHPRNTLSRQLLIPLVSSFVLLVAFITLLVFYGMGNSLEKSIHKQLLTTVQTQQTQLKTLFSYRALNAAAWAKLEVMDDIITGDVDGRINRSIQDLKNSYQLHGDILVFDTNNKLVAASDANYLLQSVELDSIPVYQVPSNAIAFESKHLNPYSIDYSVAFVHSIKASFDDTIILGVVVVTIPWRQIQQIIIPEQGQGPTHGLLLDENGAELIGNIDGTMTFTSTNLIDRKEIVIADEDYLMATASLDLVQNMPLHWLILSLEHKNDALIPVKTLGQNIIYVAIPLTLLMILLITLLTRRVVKPIQQLTQTVLDIAHSSDLSTHVRVNSNNETGILAESFNRMTDKLANTMSEKDDYAERLAILNTNLEQQVSERTDAYRAANDQLQLTINQLQQAQSQLVQSEKMASLGQLVAGIAHEINNPLGSINANIPVLEEYTNDLFQLISSIEEQSSIASKLIDIDYEFIRQDSPQLLASMKNAATRMKDIVLSLRNFSRLDQAEVLDIRLEDAIDNTLALLTHRLKNRITINKDYQLNKAVPCYAGLINQVLMNLLSNAEQSISNEGSITIKTWLDDKAYLSIQDSGTGMSKATMAKIFDPFFTTKPVGEGTGMGLSISYGIIEKHHGLIMVDSELGVGTTFTICLPMVFMQQEDAS